MSIAGVRSLRMYRMPLVSSIEKQWLHKFNGPFVQQTRCYSRQPYTSWQQKSGLDKFVKPTLFTIGSIGCLCFLFWWCEVFYSGAIIIQEERLQFASKKYPSFFRRIMNQPTLQTEWFLVFSLILVGEVCGEGMRWCVEWTTSGREVHLFDLSHFQHSGLVSMHGGWESIPITVALPLLLDWTF